MAWIAEQIRNLYWRMATALYNLYVDSPETIYVIGLGCILLIIVMLPWGDTTGRRYNKYRRGMYL